MVAINHDKSLSVDEIRDLFVVNPDTGEIHWRKCGMGRHRNKPAGCLVGPGYRKVGLRIEGKYIQFYAHRIVWTWVHGKWPDFILDHINGNKDDNRIVNLRPSTYSENRVNSGVFSTNKCKNKWVSKRKSRSGWQGAVWFGSVRKNKYFPAKEAAYEWASATAKQLHGEFYNPGQG